MREFLYALLLLSCGAFLGSVTASAIAQHATPTDGLLWVGGISAALLIATLFVVKFGYPEGREECSCWDCGRRFARYRPGWKCPHCEANAFPAPRAEESHHATGSR